MFKVTLYLPIIGNQYMHSLCNEILYKFEYPRHKIEAKQIRAHAEYEKQVLPNMCTVQHSLSVVDNPPYISAVRIYICQSLIFHPSDATNHI